MNLIGIEKQSAIVRALVEGNSIRGTCRLTGAAKNTVVKLLVELGTASEAFHDRTVRSLTSKQIQVDEVWSFCYSKAKNVPAEKFGVPGVGDVWTWTAIDAESKLMVSWYVGGRDAGAGREFMHDVASRLTERVQLTSDGLAAYLLAVPEAFGNDVDYAVLHKAFGPEGTEKSPERKYSPGKINGANRKAIIGKPDQSRVSTSFVERSNLTMRMGMRRFTRLTNGFSKKIRNHECAVALFFAHYNFCRRHQTLKTTPAVSAGLADHEWSIEELIATLKEGK